MQKKYRALEFFSGIGAFSQACHELAIETIAAFDQGQDANSVFKLNYQQSPFERNLDSIKIEQIERIEKIDLWWMSPPCLPYTRKGNKSDIQDPRCKSLLNLIDLIPGALPNRILLENVPEFKDSRVFYLLKQTLRENAYHYKFFELCSSQIGTPMLRRRFFLAASRENEINEIKIEQIEKRSLADFISHDLDETLYLEDKMLQKLEAFDIVDRKSPRMTCFTSSYGKQHKASGSLLRAKNNRIRYFSAQEIVALLGFSPDFKFPPNLSNRAKWRLAGNSVDTRMISLLIKASGL